MRAGRPLWTTEALFPGYLFARFEYFERRRQINALDGVTSIVHFGEQTAPIDDSVMAELRALVRDNETVEVTADPQPGSEVVITGGSLSGLRVLVTRVMPARQRSRSCSSCSAASAKSRSSATGSCRSIRGSRADGNAETLKR